jgi:hypothetical protein
MVFCDNVTTVYMSRNPVHHKRTKHIELDIHFLREKVAIGEVRQGSCTLYIYIYIYIYVCKPLMNNEGCELIFIASSSSLNLLLLQEHLCIQLLDRY